MKDITLNKASDGTTNGATTKITNEGLTITPANAGANNANTISVTTSGISAGNKEITNVASALKNLWCEQWRANSATASTCGYYGCGS